MKNVEARRLQPKEPARFDVLCRTEGLHLPVFQQRGTLREMLALQQRVSHHPERQILPFEDGCFVFRVVSEVDRQDVTDDVYLLSKHGPRCAHS